MNLLTNIVEYLRWALYDLPIIDGKSGYIEIRFKCIDSEDYKIIQNVAKCLGVRYFSNKIFINYH